MKLSMILAIEPVTGIIGVDGKLPWHIPADLKRFKELTTGHAVIMGRKTWESLPVRPLPNRQNIVVASKLQVDAFTFGTLGNAIAYSKQIRQPSVFIIGGAQLYDQAIDLVDEVHLTKVNVPPCWHMTERGAVRISSRTLASLHSPPVWKFMLEEDHGSHIYQHLVRR